MWLGHNPYYRKRSVKSQEVAPPPTPSVTLTLTLSLEPDPVPSHVPVPVPVPGPCYYNPYPSLPLTLALTSTVGWGSRLCAAGQAYTSITDHCSCGARLCAPAPRLQLPASTHPAHHSPSPMLSPQQPRCLSPSRPLSFSNSLLEFISLSSLSLNLSLSLSLRRPLSYFLVGL